MSAYFEELDSPYKENVGLNLKNTNFTNESSEGNELLGLRKSGLIQNVSLKKNNIVKNEGNKVEVGSRAELIKLEQEIKDKDRLIIDLKNKNKLSEKDNQLINNQNNALLVENNIVKTRFSAKNNLCIKLESEIKNYKEQIFELEKKLEVSKTEFNTITKNKDKKIAKLELSIQHLNIKKGTLIHQERLEELENLIQENDLLQIQRNNLLQQQTDTEDALSSIEIHMEKLTSENDNLQKGMIELIEENKEMKLLLKEKDSELLSMGYANDNNSPTHFRQQSKIDESFDNSLAGELSFSTKGTPFKSVEEINLENECKQLRAEKEQNLKNFANIQNELFRFKENFETENKKNQLLRHEVKRQKKLYHRSVAVKWDIIMAVQHEILNFINLYPDFKESKRKKSSLAEIESNNSNDKNSQKFFLIQSPLTSLQQIAKTMDRSISHYDDRVEYMIGDGLKNVKEKIIEDFTKEKALAHSKTLADRPSRFRWFSMGLIFGPLLLVMYYLLLECFDDAKFMLLEQIDSDGDMLFKPT